MQVHNLKRKTPNKKKMTVARGGKRGKTAGRGTKGQKARAGHKIRPEIRDLIKRIPKLRGHGKNSNFSIQEKPLAINVEILEKYFASGDQVTRESLIEKGVVNRRNGKIPAIKILGAGDLKKKLIIRGLPISGQARQKIEKAGGATS